MRGLCIMKFFLTARQDEHLSSSAQIARNFLRTLLQDDDAKPLHPQALATLLHALFVERNPDLLREFRQSLREVLNDFPAIVNDLRPAAANAILTYILCLLPHAEIKPGHIYEIPVYLNDHWATRSYRVSDIRLTPIWGLEAYTMTDNAHVFAYGFEPVHEKELAPFLVFKGTPTLTGQGFSNYLLHALNPFAMSPKNLLRRDHSRLNAWFAQCLTNQKAKVYAFGEGAAMAAEIFTNNEALNEQISTINAYNPSVSTQHSLQNLAISTNMEMSTAAENIEGNVRSKLVINMFNYAHDRLAMMSKNLPDDNPSVSRYLISPSSPSSQRRFLMNHVLCFAGKGELNMAQPYEEVKRWWFMAAANQALCHLAFGLLVLPCHFLVLPVVRAVLQHKTEALILASMVFVFSMFPLYTTPLGIAATVAAALYLTYKMLPALKRLTPFAPEPKPICHQFPDSRDLQEPLSFSP